MKIRLIIKISKRILHFVLFFLNKNEKNCSHSIETKIKEFITNHQMLQYSTTPSYYKVMIEAIYLVLLTY